MLHENSFVFLFHAPLVIMIAHVRRQTRHILGLVGLDLALAQVGEPVAESPADIVVFESRVFDRLEEVNGLQVGALISLGISHERRGAMNHQECSARQ